jgi:hypothetical protein
MAQNDSCLATKTPVNTSCQYYIDSQTNQCVQNCSNAGVVPYISGGVLYCAPTAQAPTSSVATIDSSTYKLGDGSTLVFFVMDSSLQSSNAVDIPIMTEASAPRLAADGTRVAASVQTASLQNGFLFLQDSNPNNQLWILNATGSQQKIASSSNLALSNTVYGVDSGQGHSVFMKTWLAYIGYIMGPVLIVLHAVFIGNDLLYKVDNTLILAQTVYFFSFVQLLVGKLLSQFYYGWLFSMFGFFPNFFANTVPSSYVELAAPNSYKLATIDANIVRNAGWAFSLFLVFLGAWGIITFICWMLKAVFSKPDAWHPRIAVNSLLGAGEYLAFPVFYWSVANLLYIGSTPNSNQGFYGSSRAVSIFFIVFISLYGTARWFFNVLGGLYMYKRIIVATILAASYMDDKMLAPLCVTEAVFLFCRYIIESPEKKQLLGMMVFESLLHITVYLLGYLSQSAGINTILISVIIFILIVVLAYGLTEVYLESQNEC